MMNRLFSIQPGLLATLLTLSVLSFSLTGCDDDDDDENNVDPNTQGMLTLRFDHQVDGRQLDQCCGGLSNPDEVYAINNGQDSITLNKIRYWVTGVTLNGVNGTADWSAPNSYHLVQLNPGDSDNVDLEAVKTSFMYTDVPVGEYESVTFTLGVDSTENSQVPNGQYGELEAGIGMDWTWSSGYIFYKQEGTYYDPDSGWLGYFIHIGRNPNKKEITLALDETLNTGMPHGHELRFNMDLARVFTGGEDIVSVLNQKAGDPRKLMNDPNNDFRAADNYSQAFSGGQVIHDPSSQHEHNQVQ